MTYPPLALGQAQLPTGRRLPLVRVERCALDDAWTVLVQHHYLKRRRTMAQMTYAVIVRGVVDGYCAIALPFGRGDRDGVPAMQCLELARLWLASNVRYTASGAIIALLRRVRADSGGGVSHLPRIVALCSYSDETRHSGAIYKHAGFVDCGARPGHLPGNRVPHADLLHTKRLWMYRWPQVSQP